MSKIKDLLKLNKEKVLKGTICGALVGIGLMAGIVIGITACSHEVKAGQAQTQHDLYTLTKYYQYKISENKAYEMLYKDAEKQIQQLTIENEEKQNQLNYINETTAMSKSYHDKLMADSSKIPYQKLDTNFYVTAKELNTWIDKQAPKDSPFRNNGEVFIEASKKSKLNPYYIVAHAALESAWGTSAIANEKHNYFGITAYNNSPGQSATSFDSFTNGIIGGAEWIAKNYTTEGQNTLDSMIFGPKAYCQLNDGTPSQAWINQISDIMSSSGKQK